MLPRNDRARILVVLDTFENKRVFFADVESVCEVDGEGRNCVMYAVHHSQLDTLQMLLESRAPVNLQTRGEFMSIVLLLLNRRKRRWFRS